MYNYYAFGSPKCNARSAAAEAGNITASTQWFDGKEGYRFGFNGEEKDDDVMGIGIFLNYGLRAFDSRLCRFVSVDPLSFSYPFYTPFQFAGNNPIRYIDLDGAEQENPPPPGKFTESYSDYIPDYYNAIDTPLYKRTAIDLVSGAEVEYYCTETFFNGDRRKYYWTGGLDGDVGQWQLYYSQAQVDAANLSATVAFCDAGALFVGLGPVAMAGAPLIPEAIAASGAGAAISSVSSAMTAAAPSLFGFSTDYIFLKGTASAVIQYTIKGQIDCADCVADGVLLPGSGSVVGGALDFPLLPNQDGSIPVAKTIFDDKSLTQAANETFNSLMWGVGLGGLGNAASGAVDPLGSAGASMMTRIVFETTVNIGEQATEKKFIPDQ
ncbi:MAG: hypothetical protein RL660_2507 [Bacteroidota bacterium]|jgi:RHS repeat-associated protein